MEVLSLEPVITSIWKYLSVDDVCKLRSLSNYWKDAAYYRLTVIFRRRFLEMCKFKMFHPKVPILNMQRTLRVYDMLKDMANTWENIRTIYPRTVYTTTSSKVIISVRRNLTDEMTIVRSQEFKIKWCRFNAKVKDNREYIKRMHARKLGYFCKPINRAMGFENALVGSIEDVVVFLLQHMHLIKTQYILKSIY